MTAPPSDVSTAGRRSSAPRRERVPFGAGLAIGAVLICVQALALTTFGQPLICTCGVVRLWVGDVTSAELSQQIADWYTFSHVIHGFLFYAALRLLLPRSSVGLRFALAVGIEAGWEILENTPMIIERYRQSALAAGYVGDSVLNSVSDTLAATLGFLLARRLPVAVTVAIAIGFEVFTGVMIRDNLTLNILQLLHPTEAVSRWQAGH
ncbi:MAG TPA: DUF2585 domain-containing protein [Alphaproteobacteria bacterium]|jgi:hypothetical protein|nr:DUF2585 domain-containing protein [Alphaproteobacteria bacterium]